MISLKQNFDQLLIVAYITVATPSMFRCTTCKDHECNSCPDFMERILGFKKNNL